MRDRRLSQRRARADAHYSSLCMSLWLVRPAVVTIL